MKIEAEWMRGGTSKCWVFETDHLERAGANLDDLLPRLFGSPDSRQIDGVGGATSTTSKAMILSRPADHDVDVEFTFAQVGIEEASVDWGSNCGNCSAVVGLYAIEKGWVVPDGDSTRIVTRNTNTGQIIIQRVSTPAGALPIVPDAQMPGVVFPGYRVGLGFQNPAGKTTGRLLPTGSATDTIVAAEPVGRFPWWTRAHPWSWCGLRSLDWTLPAMTRGKPASNCNWTPWTTSVGRQLSGWEWRPLPPKPRGLFPNSQSLGLPKGLTRNVTSTS